MKKYELPSHYRDWISLHLKDTGFKLDKPQALAEAVLKVSDRYQSLTSVTDWKDPATRAAYLAYYFPLNSIRFMKVLDEIKRTDFLQDMEQIVDFGCGPGPSTKLIARDKDFSFIQSIIGIDNHSEVRSDFMDTPRSQIELSFSMERPQNDLSKSAIVASYVLNELTGLPLWFYQAEALVILEPSTKQAFESFKGLRQELIDRSYDLWAPCTHSLECPLGQSKKDWCHDRVHWTAPDWFLEIEKHLPIKNESLTFSYLLARKKKKEKKPFSRVVGDALVEKGKTRWMLCQSNEREFLSFLKRQGTPPQLYRGDLVHLKNSEKKGNEIRFSNDDLEKI